MLGVSLVDGSTFNRKQNYEQFQALTSSENIRTAANIAKGDASHYKKSHLLI